MANVQTEKGYLKMATELVEQFCKYRLSGREWQVLWAIIRKTYGWRKAEDHIALSQIAKMTILPRDVVCKILNKLVGRGVVKKDNSSIRNIRLVKDYEQWKVLSKKTTVVKKDNKGVVKKDNRVLSKKTTTIDTITIDNIKITSAQIENLLDGFNVFLKDKILLYLKRAALKNKSGVISEGRKVTLLTELFNARTRCNNDDLFGQALDVAINYDVCCIGYVNAVIKNKLTKRPT